MKKKAGVLKVPWLGQVGIVVRDIETGGVIIEYIQARFMGVPFPMRSPLLRLAARLAAIAPGG